MGLFKSREERRLERDIEVRKGMNTIKRAIRDLEKNEQEYIRKARRAKQIGSAEQFDFLKKTLRKTYCQRRLMERQLLAIETAAQIKTQAEAHAQFARSMSAVSRAIAEMFGATDLARTEKNFEKAMAKAESMERRMELFLDMSAESMMGAGMVGEDLVSEEEIDKLIEEEVAREEKVLDKEITDGLEEVQKELGKD